MSLKSTPLQLAGVTAYALAVILGVSSLPSVARSLSWREFRMLQSRFGWVCLIMATLHCIIEGWPKKIIAFDCIFPSTNQLPLYLPLITIALKLPLSLIFRCRLKKIREGIDAKDQKGCCWC